MSNREIEAERAARFNLYLIKPDQIQKVWEASDPCAAVKKLVLDHIEEWSETTGQDWRSWDQNENRFEQNELKWIADYNIRNLCFIKSDLGILDHDTVAHIMQVLWKTLDLLNVDPPLDLTEATANRFEIIHMGLKRIFEERIINKDQVKKVLDYAKKTIFGHMQLYLACIGRKKQATRIKKVEIFAELPQMCELPDLET